MGPPTFRRPLRISTPRGEAPWIRQEEASLPERFFLRNPCEREIRRRRRLPSAERLVLTGNNSLNSID
jgi:hypothetical protein